MQIRKPILDKRGLKMGLFSGSSIALLDEVLIDGGVLEVTEVSEIKMTTCIANKISLQSVKIEDLALFDSFLNSVDFSGAVIVRAFFERAVISKSRFQGTQIFACIARDTSIENSKCNDSSLRFSKMKNVIFSDCDLSNSDFLGAEMENVIFKNCNLTNSQFSHSKLTKVSFKESDIQGIAINKDSFGEVTVNTGQAIYLASCLGLNIED